MSVIHLAMAFVLCACTPQAPADVIDKAQGQVAEEVAEQERDLTQVLLPPVLALQEAAAAITASLPASDVPRETLHPDALDLIVAFEVVSPAYYELKFQGVICPGGASGPTWGIGYDGGHQSEAVIRREWAGHPDVDRLVTASGVIGDTPCKAWRARHRDIRVPLAMAQAVFEQTMVPSWLRSTRRAYPGIDVMTVFAEGGMTSNTFNRGTSFRGSRAIEKREIRDNCVPAGDAPCAAHQVRLSCRIWRGTNLERGLCRRRNGEGDLIERIH